MKTEHIHKYKLIEIGGEKIIRDPVTKKKKIVKTSSGSLVFKCILPGCKSFKERHLTLGEKSICWNCEQEMIMTNDSIKRSKPIHWNCRKERVA